MTGTRSESDSMGPIEVPADRYWGAQTERSLLHFPIGSDVMPRPLLRAIGILKGASARANADLGVLDPDLAALIEEAANEVIARDARRAFPPPRLADRQRHADQHERQRGDLQPGDRARRRRARVEITGSSERPRQHVAVLQRHLPDRYAHSGRRGANRPVSFPPFERSVTLSRRSQPSSQRS